MSTAILPDDSIVVRLPDRTVHVDARSRAVQVRATQAGRELGGSLVASHQFGDVERVRISVVPEGGVGLHLDLSNERSVPLGLAPSSDVAMLTGRAVADLCRCKLEAGQGISVLARPSATFSEAVTYDGTRAELTAQPRSDSERITDERPRAERSAPSTPSAPPRQGSLRRVTREIVRPTRAQMDEPLFGALFRESEMAQAMDPLAVAGAMVVDPDTGPPASPPRPDENATLVGVAAVGGRPEAVAELLALAAEALPIADREIASTPPARSGS